MKKYNMIKTKLHCMTQSTWENKENRNQKTKLLMHIKKTFLIIFFFYKKKFV